MFNLLLQFTEKISLPNSVGYIGEDVFGTQNTIKDRKLQIICEPNSYVKRCVNENGLTVIGVGNETKFSVNYNVKVNNHNRKMKILRRVAKKILTIFRRVYYGS